MDYTLDQELKINEWGKEKVRSLHDELNDKKTLLSDYQREQLIRELKSCQEILYINRLNRQIDLAPRRRERK